MHGHNRYQTNHFQQYLSIKSGSPLTWAADIGSRIIRMAATRTSYSCCWLCLWCMWCLCSSLKTSRCTLRPQRVAIGFPSRLPYCRRPTSCGRSTWPRTRMASTPIKWSRQWTRSTFSRSGSSARSSSGIPEANPDCRPQPSASWDPTARDWRLCSKSTPLTLTIYSTAIDIDKISCYLIIRHVNPFQSQWMLECSLELFYRIELSLLFLFLRTMNTMMATTSDSKTKQEITNSPNANHWDRLSSSEVPLSVSMVWRAFKYIYNPVDWLK